MVADQFFLACAQPSMCNVSTTCCSTDVTKHCTAHTACTTPRVDANGG